MVTRSLLRKTRSTGQEKPKPVLMSRRCKYCRATFVPSCTQGKEAKFCCENHRKAYWRFGGLPYDKMREQILKDVRKFLRSELEQLIAEARSAGKFELKPNPLAEKLATAALRMQAAMAEAMQETNGKLTGA